MVIPVTAPPDKVAVPVAVVPTPTPTSNGAAIDTVHVLIPLPPLIINPVTIPAVEIVAVTAADTGSAAPLTIIPVKSLAESYLKRSASSTNNSVSLDPIVSIIFAVGNINGSIESLSL